VEALKRLEVLAPGRSIVDSAPLMKLELRYEFEPHGRASETWEDVWVLTLPHVHPHWKGISTWMRCGENAIGPMSFKGTLSYVMAYATDFLEWYRNHPSQCWAGGESADDGAIGEAS
jgi:hypothetical protein